MARPANTDERRTQIAEALLRAMAEHGYDGSSIQTIASEADLSPGLVHYHFKNKLGILLEALDLLVLAHNERLNRALANATTPIERVAAFIDAHLGLGAEADPVALKCWVLMSGEALRREEVAAAFGEAMTGLKTYLRRAIADGAFEADPDEASAALLATIQGYFTLAATSPDLVPHGSAARMTRAMAAGLLGTELP